MRKPSRNRITFSLPDGNPGKVSLVDTFSNYIAVVVELNALESHIPQVCQNLCPEICDTVYANIRRAVAALHYTGTIPQLAFFCPESSRVCSTSAHTAIIRSDLGGVTCSNEPSIFRPLTEENKVWLTGLQSTSSASAECPKLYQLTCFQTGSTSVNIVENVSTKCYEFGISLLQDETGAKIVTIAAQCMKDPYMMNLQILTQWLQGGGKQPVTWATLASELDRIGLKELAKDVQTFS